MFSSRILVVDNEIEALGSAAACAVDKIARERKSRWGSNPFLVSEKVSV